MSSSTEKTNHPDTPTTQPPTVPQDRSPKPIRLDDVFGNGRPPRTYFTYDADATSGRTPCD